MSQVFFKNSEKPETVDEAREEELVARFGEALSPLVRRFGYEGIDSIGLLLARLRKWDPRAALVLMEKSPVLIEALLPYGEERILQAFDLAQQMIPFGPLLTLKFLEMSPRFLEKSDFETLIKTSTLIGEVADVQLELATSLIGKSPELLEAAGFEGLRKLAFFCMAIAESSRTYALKILENNLSIIQPLQEMGGIPLIRSVFNLGIKMAAEDWNCALEFIEKSPALASKLQAPGPGFDLFDLAARPVPFSARMALTLLDVAPYLTGRLGLTGLDSIWRCAQAMGADTGEKAVTLLRESPGLVDRLLTYLTSDRVKEIYELGSELAGVGAESTLQFLRGSVELARQFDFSRLKIVAETAKAMAGTSRITSEAFLKAAPALLARMDPEELRKFVEDITPLALESWETASQLLQKSPELIDRLGLEGLEKIMGFSALLSRESGSAAVQFLDKCPHLVDDLLKKGDVSLVFEVCGVGRRSAQTNARLAVSLVNRSSQIIGLIGFEGLEKVEALALHIGPENWTTAVSLVEMSPSLLERMDYEGLKRISDAARHLAGENSYAAVSLLEKAPDLIDRLSKTGTKNQILHIYDLVGETAVLSWRLANTLLEKSPELLSKLGAEGMERVVALIISTAQVNGQIAVRLLDLSPVLLDQIGFEGLEIAAGLISLLAGSDWMAALALLEKSPLLIDRLGHFRERAIAPVVFDLAAKVARTSPAAAMRLLEKSPELIDWVGWEGFGEIAAFIENTAAIDEEKALSFLAGDSPTWTDFLENVPKGMELKAIQPILSTYLKALLGRRVEITESAKAYTDGNKIHLPGRIRDFQSQEDNFLAYKVSATHLEAHLEYGSFEFDLNRMEGCLTGKGFPPGIETREGESDIEQFVRLFPEPDLARDLFNLLEDRRIEKILMREYPALGEEISRMNLHQVSKRGSPQKITNPKQRIVEMVGQALLAGKDFQDGDPQTLAILQQALEKADFLGQAGADVHTAAGMALDLYLLIDAQFQESYRPAKPLADSLDQDKVFQNIGSFGKTSRQIQDRIRGRQGVGGNRPRTQPEAESGSEGETQPSQSRPSQDHIHQRQQAAGKEQRTFQGPAGGGKQESGDDDPGGEETGRVGEVLKFDSREKIERLLKALYREKGITPREIERRMESLRQNELYLFLQNLEALLDKKTELQIERGTALYPEWGEDIQDYRGNWARIREQTLPGKSLGFYREVLDKHSGLLKKIRREFQMLKPEGFIRRKRQYDGDDIDLEAVVENWVDRKVGLSPSEKNYTLHQKKKRDIAVAFLIDMSRSTKGATIELEKEALIIMSEALNEVGDAFAVFGFSGDNRDNVDYFRIKSFDDPYDHPVKKRISAITDCFENRDGTAIRHTISKLRRRSERTKLLILLSDGKPVDKEYSGTYAIEDTRLALKEARHYGIRTFCITVDRTAAEYLPRMYSHSSWTVIDEVNKLPEKITRIYHRLTA
ncbi:MAG: VWA domain-containing protein [Deltaproteobacteria bacterium]|nr:VWA domain-containing protein [Deltaproteobacteria bacterium]